MRSLCVSIKVMVSNFDTCQSLLYTQPLNQRESPQPTRYLAQLPLASYLVYQIQLLVIVVLHVGGLYQRICTYLKIRREVSSGTELG